jgi:hypothetical protein
MKKKMITYNAAYKCLYFEDGLILVFNDITPFKENEIQLDVINGELLVYFGNNVALLSSKAIKHLKETKKLYLTKCGLEEYEDDSYQYALETDSNLLSKLEGIMLVLEKMKEMIPQIQKNQNVQTNQENKKDEENKETQENKQKEIKQNSLIN